VADLQAGPVAADQLARSGGEQIRLAENADDHPGLDDRQPADAMGLEQMLGLLRRLVRRDGDGIERHQVAGS